MSDERSGYKKEQETVTTGSKNSFMADRRAKTNEPHRTSETRQEHGGDTHAVEGKTE